MPYPGLLRLLGVRARVHRHALLGRLQHGAAAHPPAASTSFIAVDRGCCNPRYMRSTMSTIPHTGELLASSGMPLSIMVQPLAIPSPEEDPIQVVDNGDQGPLRCSR